MSSLPQVPKGLLIPLPQVPAAVRPRLASRRVKCRPSGLAMAAERIRKGKQRYPRCMLPPGGGKVIPGGGLEGGDFDERGAVSAEAAAKVAAAGAGDGVLPCDGRECPARGSLLRVTP